MEDIILDIGECTCNIRFACEVVVKEDPHVLIFKMT